MLLLYILLVPVVVGADRKWNFEQVVVTTNENNTLTGIEKIPDVGYLEELDLSNLGLEDIDPNAFDNVTYTRVLNLTNNWLRTLPKNVFSKLTYLRHLSLAENNISSFDRVFAGLRDLQTLDLSNNQLEHIGEGYLYGLDGYQHILTKGNVFSNISTRLFKEPHETLENTILENKSDFTNNSTDLPTINFTKINICNDMYRQFDWISGDCSIATAKHIGLRLSLKYMRWSERNVGFKIFNGLPEYVVELDLTYNSLIILEPGIENLYLRTLILDHSEIRDMSDYALAKTNLSVLSLNYNSLQHAKFAKTLPSSLEELYLRNNEFRNIPRDSFSGLKNLVKLDLSHNYLTNIEAGSFRNLPALRELNLYKNRVIIYKGIFAGLESLEYLNIGANRLKETKNILFAMPDTLETVILDFNEIKTLEARSFVRVPKRKLSLKGNNIDRFVEGSFNLPSLKELDLGNNRLTQLDREFFKGLASLEQLSLARNSITELNNGDLQYLDKLEILDLSYNPIKYLGRGTLRGMVMSEKSLVFLSGVPIEGIQDPFRY